MRSVIFSAQYRRYSAVVLCALTCIACSDATDGTAAHSAIKHICDAYHGSSETIDIPAGIYRLGDDRYYPEERPVRTISIDAFNIDATETTNQQFAEFVSVTGYVTRAERGLPETKFATIPGELRKPGSVVFTPPSKDGNLNPDNWWRFVEGASWHTPHGPGSSIEGLESHPVVHVAFEDANAYADWKGRRLPTEVEWEAAARGRDNATAYSWGDTPPDDLDKQPANTWQGIFPFINQQTDGYEGTAPTGCFEPNQFGLYDMIGNVWEMTSTEYSPSAGVVKGGSYLCAENFCLRYRPAARQPHEWALGSSHIGFRTAK